MFVNLDGEAAPLAPRLAGAEPYIRNYHLDAMHFYYTREEVWGTNWKCLVENAMEGYHLSRVHGATLQSTPTQLCEKIPGADGYTGYPLALPAGVTSADTVPSGSHANGATLLGLPVRVPVVCDRGGSAWRGLPLLANSASSCGLPTP